MTATRILAIRSLIEISNQGKKPKAVLEANASGADRQDRAFLMEIVYGVLRYRMTLDWVLARFLTSPQNLSDFTINNLRSALYQILFMRVPDWASVNEAVDAEKSSGSPRRASLVNAVLRNFLRQREQFSLPLKTGDPIADISLNTSTPLWLIQRWITRFGHEETQSLCEANNIVPPLCLRTNTLKTTREHLLEELASRGIEAKPAVYSPEGIMVLGVHSYADLSFAEGGFFVQDESSQLIGHLLNPHPGERVLDACAAPGGKTTHLAQLMEDKGEIVAVEKDPLRAATIRRNTDVLGISSVKVLTSDFLDIRDIGNFDRVLVDAPCSTLGVIRKNPDVKYRHQERNLAEFRSRQGALLRHAASFLKPGGTLVYAVCSTEPEEGEDVIAAFLKQRPDFRIIEPDNGFPPGLVRGGFMRTYPHLHAMDGFFGARLCNRE